MRDSGLQARGKALEEEFFAKQNKKLLAKLQEKAAAQACRQGIAEATGITNDAVLERLAALGLCSETVVALSLVPSVEVAWADGRIQNQERTAILAAAKESGIAEGSPSHQLLDSWLQQAPGTGLLGAWKQYVAALAESLGGEATSTLKDELLSRARAVAEAAGGILGLGTISGPEEAKLAELESAFSPAG